jgi:hypothetical protein
VTDPGPGARLRASIQLTAERTTERASRGLRHDDADETVGTIDTDDAVGFDPRPVLAALSAQGAPAVVIGQVAGILHGSSEPTGDLDLLWSGIERDAPAMTAAFGSLDADLTDDDGRPVDLRDAFALPKVLFRTSTAAGDCCTPRLPWKGLEVEAFLERAVAATIEGDVIVWYLAIEDLVAMRLASGRPKDVRRAAELTALLEVGPRG